MAKSNRRTGPGRWAVVAGTAVATAGFLGAILTGPQPSGASAPPTVLAQVATPTPSISARPGSGAATRRGITLAPAPLPRLRTRGS